MRRGRGSHPSHAAAATKQGEGLRTGGGLSGEMADEAATSDGRGRRGSGVASATGASKAADGFGEGEVAGAAASGSGAGQDGPAQERDPGLEEDEEEEEEEEEEEGGDAAAQGAEGQAAGEGDAAQDDEMAVPFEDDMYGESHCPIS